MDNPVCIPNISKWDCSGGSLSGLFASREQTILQTQRLSVSPSNVLGFPGRSERVEVNHVVDQRVYSCSTFYLLKDEGTHGDNRHQRTGARRIETVRFFHRN